LGKTNLPIDYVVAFPVQKLRASTGIVTDKEIVLFTNLMYMCI